MQKIGIIEEYKTSDLGKYNISKNEDDKYYFKVPSLRNIALTAPYFHNGKVETLKDGVAMAIDAIDSGKAKACLKKLIAITNA